MREEKVIMEFPEQAEKILQANAQVKTRVGPDIRFGRISGQIMSILFDIKD